MDLRKEVEKLLYWYIPALLISTFIGYFVATLVKSMNGMPIWMTSLSVGISLFTGHIHNVVVAVWLYFLAKKMDQRYVLWALFGLTSHVFAVVIFLVINLIEEKMQEKTLHSQNNQL